MLDKMLNTYLKNIPADSPAMQAVEAITQIPVRLQQIERCLEELTRLAVANAIRLEELEEYFSVCEDDSAAYEVAEEIEHEFLSRD